MLNWARPGSFTQNLTAADQGYGLRSAADQGYGLRSAADQGYGLRSAADQGYVLRSACQRRPDRYVVGTVPIPGL